MRCGPTRARSLGMASMMTATASLMMCTDMTLQVTMGIQRTTMAMGPTAPAS
ncbi:unnamed protein product [Effrenium voratum]|nr:unnamed protein product [Effrenium voratum]